MWSTSSKHLPDQADNTGMQLGTTSDSSQQGPCAALLVRPVNSDNVQLWRGRNLTHGPHAALARLCNDTRAQAAWRYKGTSAAHLQHREEGTTEVGKRVRTATPHRKLRQREQQDLSLSLDSGTRITLYLIILRLFGVFSPITNIPGNITSQAHTTHPINTLIIRVHRITDIRFYTHYYDLFWESEYRWVFKMPLTPIHIRGKKRTADKVSSAAPNSSAGPASPAAAGKEVMAPKKKSGRAESSRRVSILERLPVELLVMVFTESQNMDLQFCSRHIHTALNNYYSHVRLVARAFAPTWSMNHGKRRSKLVEAANPPVPAKEFQDIVRYQVRYRNEFLGNYTPRGQSLQGLIGETYPQEVLQHRHYPRRAADLDRHVPAREQAHPSLEAVQPGRQV